jgi:hypothetical protein
MPQVLLLESTGGFRDMSIGPGTRMLSQGLLSRSGYPTKGYSPKYVEEVFSEIHIQDPE